MVKITDCKFGSKNSSVNWYGQVIKVDFHSGFKFHLDVCSGRPVNPLSPTRRGLIKDAAYEALIRFVKDKVFGFVFDMGNRPQVKPEYVAACFNMDGERARRESPYIVAAELLPLVNPLHWKASTAKVRTSYSDMTQCPGSLRKA